MKNSWKLIKASSSQKQSDGELAFDGDPDTYWQSKENTKLPQYISIDLGDQHTIHGFAYIPHTDGKDGMIESGSVFISSNKKKYHKEVLTNTYVTLKSLHS